MSFESNNVLDHLEFMNGRTFACMFVCSLLVANRSMTASEVLATLKAKHKMVADGGDTSPAGVAFLRGLESMIPLLGEMVASTTSAHLLLSDDGSRTVH